MAGSLAGIVFGPAIEVVSPLGDVFVRLLKLIVMPVVVFTLIVGAASIHPARLGRVGLKAMLLYTITTFFAILFGMGVAYLRESEDDRIRKAVNTVFDFFDGGAEVMYKVVNWILQYAPIGVFP